MLGRKASGKALGDLLCSGGAEEAAIEQAEIIQLWYWFKITSSSCKEKSREMIN